MPTVFQINGFEVRIRTRDHPPPHVHIYKGDGQIKIQIGSEMAPVEIMKVWMNHSDAKKAVTIVEENQRYLLAK